MNVLAYGLDPSAGLPEPNWRAALGQDYRVPTVKISTEEAIAHRLRRVYLWLITITLAAWVVRITAFVSQPWPASAAVGQIPGIAVTVAVALFYLVAVVVTARPREWQSEDELRTQDIGKHR